jgi:WD40 repeat protein
MAALTPLAPGGGVMRLLPRSPAGTWALAGVTWLSLSVAAWWLLPPQPRAEWHNVPPVAWARVRLPGSSHTILVPPLASAVPTHPNMLVFWDSATGQTHELFSDEDDLPAFGFSPDGTWVLLGVDNRLQLRDVASGATVAELEVTDRPPEEWRRRYLFTPDGSVLVYSDWVAAHDVVRLFDLNTRKAAGVVADAEAPLAFADDGRTFAFRAAGECRVVEWPGGRVRFRLPDNGVDRYELSPTGERLIRFQVDNVGQQVECWNLADGKSLWDIATSASTALPGDGKKLFACRYIPDVYPKISLWDTRDGECLGELSLKAREMFVDVAHGCSPIDGTVAIITIYPEDRLGEWLETWVPWLGYRAQPSGVKLVDATTGRTMCAIPGGEGEPCFTTDGRGLLVRQGSMLRLWDLLPRKPWMWIAIAAGMFALPIVLLAWLQGRRLLRHF